MLVRHEVRQVCLECHANSPPPPASVAGSTNVHLNNLGQIPPAFHDLRSQRFQNCSVCHVKVHGSYVVRNFVRSEPDWCSSSCSLRHAFPPRILTNPLHAM